ncbi:hypothetical protein T484DRAFT_1932625 [Baffinella frigidus]|nr:hypothetical protein T484DRAFT_1932625 [Cryptophyta sp. CCMP2293]
MVKFERPQALKVHLQRMGPSTALLRLATALVLCWTCSAEAVFWMEVLVPWDGQTVATQPGGSNLSTLTRLTGLQKGSYLFEVWHSTGEGDSCSRTKAAAETIIVTWVSEAAQEGGVSMEMGVEVSELRPGDYRIEFDVFKMESDEEVGPLVATRAISISVARLPPYLDAGEDGGVAEGGGMAIGECSMVVDTSPDLLATPESMLVGFVEGRGGAVLRLEDMPDRHCLLYRAVEVSECRREGGKEDGRMVLPPLSERPLASAAIVSALGPIDVPSLTPWSAWNEKVVALIVANRACFARREQMDFLLAIGTSQVLAGRHGWFLKFPSLKAALREYNTAVWVDMDGYMGYAPRPAHRKCVPFTTCWPPHLSMIFSQAGGGEDVGKAFPNTGIFILRRSLESARYINAVWARGHERDNDQTETQHYLLERFSQAGASEYQYQGECGLATSKRDHCWRDAIAHGARIPHHSVQNISLSNHWCRPDDLSGVMLTCPCNPDNATDWCDELPEAKVAGGGLCSIAWCAGNAPLFVHFGSFMFKARLPEVVTNSFWACQGYGAAR